MTAETRTEPIVELFRLQQQDFDDFAALSGDANPIHVDPEFAVGTVFGATVAHGMLLFTRLRGALTRHYPDGSLIGQELMFRNPAYADQELRLVLTPGQTLPSEPFLTIGVEVVRPDGLPCLEGECRLVSRRESVSMASLTEDEQ